MDNSIGWLSPTGELIECSSYDHGGVAIDLVKELYPNEEYTGHYIPGGSWASQDILESHQWVKLIPNYKSDFMMELGVLQTRPFTKKQVEWLQLHDRWNDKMEQLDFERRLMEKEKEKDE